MKANRKFLNKEDEAVSPVIAVILMVAITVVLAATVYVWVSGFGAQSSQPAKTMSLTSAQALATQTKVYTVSAATSGMKYSDVTFTIDGGAYNQSLASPSGGAPGTGTCASTSSAASLGDTTAWQACSGATVAATTNVIQAGDTLVFQQVASGQTLRILDSQANSVVLTLTIG